MAATASSVPQQPGPPLQNTHPLSRTGNVHIGICGEFTMSGAVLLSALPTNGVDGASLSGAAVAGPDGFSHCVYCNRSL